MARRPKKLRRPEPGAAPGTLSVGRVERRTPIRVLHYTAERCDEALVQDLRELPKWLEKPGFVWFDHDDAPDAELLESFRDLLHLHPLAVADVANIPQRPKTETYDGFEFVVLRMFSPATNGGTHEPEQLSLFIGDRWVVTFQERPGDCLEPVRARLRAGSGNIRTAGPDYLGYAIIDAVVDGYFPVIEGLGDRLEALEERILAGGDATVHVRLMEIRRELLHVRRAVWPLREALGQLVRDAGPSRFSAQTRLFLRDCYDHVVQCIDLVENFRELASSLMELHLAAVGFRTNEVMKILTIFSSVFLPLTFIAGVYGMNFDPHVTGNMPELEWPWAYEVCLAAMFVIAVAMLVFFRRKGWLGPAREFGADR